MLKIEIIRAFHIEEPVEGGPAKWTGFAIGQVLEREAAEAQHWIDIGYAKLFAAPVPEPEPATAE